MYSVIRTGTRWGTLLSLAFLFALPFPFDYVAGAADRSPLADETRVIPDELYRYGIREGCGQVADFYKEHDDVREPPYVYGILAAPGQYADNDHSAAFWCTQTSDGEKKYVLLLKLDGKKWPGGCPDRIENQFQIGGLSIIRKLNEPLASYSYVDDAAIRPLAGRTSGPGIKSSYDGTGVIFTCNRGRWAFRQLDY